MATDWKIKKRDETCSRCEQDFDEGQGLFSVLRVEPESFGREDQCAPCFQTDDTRSPDTVFWRTRYRPKAKRGLALDFESILRLFLALDGREEDRLRELRYLLALLLMRKKRLKLVRVKRADSGEWMVLRRPRHSEVMDVAVFDLTPERAAELRVELEQIFEGAGSEDLLAAAQEAGTASESAE